MRIGTDNRTRSRGARRAGFTLMEVLVVVAILVVLAGVGGVIFLRVQEDAYRDAARLDVKSLTEACVAFQRRQGSLPQSLQQLVSPPDGGRPYVDPNKLNDPWNRPYQYSMQSQHPTNVNQGWPDIWSQGPNPGNPNDIVGNW